MRGEKDFVWTDEQIGQLKELWAEGLSASQIADRLTGDPTRNAVLGKIHRLGLSGRIKKARPPRAPRKRTRSDRPIVVRDKLLPPPLPDVADLDIPESQRCSLFTLTANACRWPVGEPGDAGFFFCGAPEADFPHQPYCRAHTIRACGIAPALSKLEIDRRALDHARARREQELIFNPRPYPPEGDDHGAQQAAE